MQYRPGDIAYIVGNTRFIQEVEILNVKYGLVTVHLLKQNSYIRVRENRLFPTKEAAEAIMMYEKTCYHDFQNIIAAFLER